MDILSKVRKRCVSHHFWGQFWQKMLAKLVKVSPSLMVREKSDRHERIHGCVILKKWRSQPFGTIRVNMSNSVSAKLPQLARLALLAGFAADCAFWKSEAYRTAWACSNPSKSFNQLLGGFPKRDQIVSQVVNDTSLSYKDKTRSLKANLAGFLCAGAQKWGRKNEGLFHHFTEPHLTPWKREDFYLLSPEIPKFSSLPPVALAKIDIVFWLGAPLVSLRIR